FYSPASAAVQMADAYLNDRKAILPCAAYLEGEYGIRGLYVGVPVQIGAGGGGRVIEIALEGGEKQAAATPAARGRGLVEGMERGGGGGGGSGGGRRGGSGPGHAVGPGGGGPRAGKVWGRGGARRACRRSSGKQAMLNSEAYDANGFYDEMFGPGPAPRPGC